jgi:hypothetical protein
VTLDQSPGRSDQERDWNDRGDRRSRFVQIGHGFKFDNANAVGAFVQD